jgi:hypothetical protein
MTQYGQEFRDENSDSNYPFVDNGTLTARTGYVLDPATFVDASLYPIGQFRDLRLRAIDRVAGAVRLIVGDAKNAEVAVGSFDPLVPDEIIELFDSFGRFAGIIIGDPDYMQALAGWPVAYHDLRDTALFVTSCCFPAPAAGILGVELPDGTLLTGDLWMYGENGVTLAGMGTGGINYTSSNYGAVVSAWGSDPSTGAFSFVTNDRLLEDTLKTLAVSSVMQPHIQPAQGIAVHIIGDPMFKQAQCADKETEDGAPIYRSRRFLKKINGVPGNQNGDFNFTVVDPADGHSILRIETEGTDTLVFTALGKRAVG